MLLLLSGAVSVAVAVGFEKFSWFVVREALAPELVFVLIFYIL